MLLVYGTKQKSFSLVYLCRAGAGVGVHVHELDSQLPQLKSTNVSENMQIQHVKSA